MKKVKVLALVMVLAFAAMGATYAVWTDQLTITETVQTGNVDVGWECFNVYASDPALGYRAGMDKNARTGGAIWGLGTGDVYVGSRDSMDSNNPNYPNTDGSFGKNVGFKDAIIRDSHTVNGQTIEKKNVLAIAMDNVYPGYQEYIGVAIKNYGTIPVKLSDPVFCVNKPEWLEIVFYDWSRATPKLIGSPVSLEGIQLNPDKIKEIAIVQRVKHTATENTSANFTATVDAVQWNAYSLVGTVTGENEYDPGTGWDLPDTITTP